MANGRQQVSWIDAPVRACLTKWKWLLVLCNTTFRSCFRLLNKKKIAFQMKICGPKKNLRSHIEQHGTAKPRPGPHNKDTHTEQSYETDKMADFNSIAIWKILSQNPIHYIQIFRVLFFVLSLSHIYRHTTHSKYTWLCVCFGAGRSTSIYC